MLNGDRHSVEALIGKPLRKANSDSASYECVAKDVSRKRKDGGRVPRPPNAFILYRSETQPKLVEKYKGTGKSSRDFSAMVGQMWREESPETRKRFSEMAAERLAQHRSRYPKYKYAPKKPSGTYPSQAQPITAERTSTKPKPRAIRQRRVHFDSDSDDEDDDASFHEEEESEFEVPASFPERECEHTGLLSGTAYNNPVIVSPAAEAAEPVGQHAGLSLVSIKSELNECGADILKAASLLSSRSSSISPRAEPLSSRPSSNSSFFLPVGDVRVADSTSIPYSRDVQQRAFGPMEVALFAHHPAFTTTSQQHAISTSVHGTSSFSSFPGTFDVSTWPESHGLYTGSSPSFDSTTTSLLEQYKQHDMEPGMNMFIRANEGQGYHHIGSSKSDHHPCFISMQDIFPQSLPYCTTSILSALSSSGRFTLPTRGSLLQNVSGLKFEMQAPVYHVAEHGNFNLPTNRISALTYVEPAATKEATHYISEAQSAWLGAKTLAPPVRMNNRSGSDVSLAATATPGVGKEGKRKYDS
ncbi:hypothetical protein BC830DRAFT_1193280 [Chytriomyces sp. MP71]|nr:hypothetical protein BC830DRAFT_1193280 [Chytriomyces sp. MP71]